MGKFVLPDAPKFGNGGLAAVHKVSGVADRASTAGVGARGVKFGGPPSPLEVAMDRSGFSQALAA